MRSLCYICSLKPSKSRLCSSVHLSQIAVWYTATRLFITLHSSSARLDVNHPVQIHLIGIRDSLDHRSVSNKEVKLIEICSLGPRQCPLSERILSEHWKLSVIERCPYREVRLYVTLTLPHRPAKIPAKRLTL